MLLEILQYAEYKLSFQEVEGMQTLEFAEILDHHYLHKLMCTAPLYNISSKLIRIGKTDFRYDNLMSANFKLLEEEM